MIIAETIANTIAAVIQTSGLIYAIYVWKTGDWARPSKKSN